MTKQQLKKKIEKHYVRLHVYPDPNNNFKNTQDSWVFNSVNELMDLIKEVVESVIPREMTKEDKFFIADSPIPVDSYPLRIGYGTAIQEMKDNLDKLLGNETK